MRMWPILATASLSLTTTASADTLHTPTTFYQDVSWSPDGTKIAFSAMVNQKPANVFVMTLKGKLVNQLTDTQSWDGWTCWSKDGARIYFSSNRDGNDEIYVMNADGSGVQRLTNNTSKDVAPCLSPDGSEIVFVSDRDGNQDIYAMSTDGSTTRRITSTPGKEYNPRWSPDGSAIVCYASSSGAKDQVYLIDPANGESRTLGSAETHNTFAGWSPDGTSVVYSCSPVEGENWIYAAALDGSKNDKLLPLPAFYASYAPDGKRVAYIGGGWPSSNIYVIDYSDGTMRCLTCDLQLWPEDLARENGGKSKKKK